MTESRAVVKPVRDLARWVKTLEQKLQDGTPWSLRMVRLSTSVKQGPLSAGCCGTTATSSSLERWRWVEPQLLSWWTSLVTTVCSAFPS